jgi:hypothetical protein
LLLIRPNATLRIDRHLCHEVNDSVKPLAGDQKCARRTNSCAQIAIRSNSSGACSLQLAACSLQLAACSLELEA